jgi:hypothetical protein
LVTYLGPYSKATDEQKAQAEQITQDLIANHELEIRRESVTRIDWHQEGFLSPGYFRFATAAGPVQIDTVRRAFGNEGVLYTDRQLIGALLMFAEDRFYNEKTGVLMAKQVQGWLQKHKDWHP